MRVARIVGLLFLLLTAGCAGTKPPPGKLGALYGVLGVGFGFLLEKSMDPLSVDWRVLVPYLAAVAGAVLWTAPPRPRPDRSEDQGASTDV